MTSGADAIVAPAGYSIAGKKPFSLNTDLKSTSLVARIDAARGENSLVEAEVRLELVEEHLLLLGMSFEHLRTNRVVTRVYDKDERIGGVPCTSSGWFDIR